MIGLGIPPGGRPGRAGVGPGLPGRPHGGARIPNRVICTSVARCLLRLLAGVMLVAGVAVAEERWIIELNDGSSITGRIVQFEDGVYTIASDTLGNLALDQEDILSIRSKRQGGNAARNGLPAGIDPGALQQRIYSDPGLMAEIMALQNDRQIQGILGDPAILQHLQSGNIGALTSDPRIIDLLNHPRIKQIQRKILNY